MADPKGFAPLNLPADNPESFRGWLSYGSVQWWEALVTLQFVTSDLV